MSWDSYIDNLVGHSKSGGDDHVDKAAICGLDGSQWTTAAHPKALQISPAESATIAKAFKSKDFTIFQSSGVVLGGIKYQFLREEDGNIVFAKKKDQGALTLQASKTGIVIAHCPEGKQQGNCNKAVAVIAEYLVSLGY